MRASKHPEGRRARRCTLALAALPLALVATAAAQTPPAHGRYGIGTPLTEARLAPWNIDVAPDGRSLPAGQGTVAAGRTLYAAQCAACHGAQGEGGQGDRLAGGAGTLASAKPVRTVGSYWPYATTLYDYIRRSMPFQSPQSLSNDQVYQVTAYILHMNGLLDENATLDAKSLVKVKMPNRDGFYVDDRPDAKNTRCMTDCLKKGADSTGAK